MTLREHLEAKLRGELAATHVEVLDESARHAGHAGAANGGHFRALVVSARFEGQGLLERHRLVHSVLADELRERVHALALTTRTPEEWARGVGA